MDADGEFKRRLESIDSIAAAGIEDGPRAVWLPEGIRHFIASSCLEEAEIAMVQDRRLGVEQRRLLGGTS